MKRASGLLLLTAACIMGFLSVRGILPFVPVFDSGMEPALKSGGLLMTESTKPQDLEVGDIIVFDVPPAVREYYNYPAILAYRVTSIENVPSLGFRVAGDAAGEYPFTVIPQHIKGTVSKQIPYLGLPLFLLQSTLGLVLCIIALVLAAVLLYRRELRRGAGILQRCIFAPVINEEKRSSQLLSRKIESTEHRMYGTEQALEKFAAAISDYATHLSSHTSAIQGLAEASQELKMSAADQNRVLAHLLKNMEEPGVLWKAPPVRQAPVVKKTQPVFKETIATVNTHKPYRKQGIFDKPMPPGCALSRETRARKALAAQKEITDALHNLQSRLESVRDQV
jgi:hypothetical protein